MNRATRTLHPIARSANTARVARTYATTGSNPKVPDSGNMSSLPPREGPAVDPHNLSRTAHVQQATAKVNRFAKRDPALYPLSAIVIAALGVAGYFFTSKAAGTDLPERKLQQHGLVNPWDDANKHDTQSKVAEFKYRHKTRDGHYEDSLPTLNQDSIKLPADYKPKYHT